MNRLDRAYALVPEIQCRGLCQAYCGPVPVSTAEASRIKARHGMEVDFDPATLTCTLLRDGKCSIYHDRPLICRLWGNVEKMQCPHGCAPALMPPKYERKACAMVYGDKPR